MTTNEKNRFDIRTTKDDRQQIKEIDIEDGKIERKIDTKTDRRTSKKLEIKTDTENREQD